DLTTKPQNSLKRPHTVNPYGGVFIGYINQTGLWQKGTLTAKPNMLSLESILQPQHSIVKISKKGNCHWRNIHFPGINLWPVPGSLSKPIVEFFADLVF